MATIQAPIRQGRIEAEINFNEKPPIIIYPKEERHLVFDVATFAAVVDKILTGDLSFLPEKNGLFGTTLVPKQERYHNFLKFKIDGDPVRYEFMPDNDGKVKEHLAASYGATGTADEGKRERLDFFSWMPIYPLYEEDSSVEGLPLSGLPLPWEKYTKFNQNSSPSTPDDELRQNSAKWGYKLKDFPSQEFGTTESSINTSTEGKVTKLVPFQEQKNDRSNGPSGRGVHWGLKKLVGLPERSGFTLDFFLEGDLDNITNPSAGVDPNDATKLLMPKFKRTLHDKFFREPSPGTSAAQVVINDQIYFGEKETVNNQFYLINKSYLLIEIMNVSKHEAIYVLITNKGIPLCFRGTKSVRGRVPSYVVELFDSYNSLSGEAMLRGVNGHLQLRIRNILNTIIIDNNIIPDPWVIKVNTFDPDDTTAGVTAPAPDAGTYNLLTTGGNLRIFGGNISCGVSYSYLSYTNSASFSIDDFKVRGGNRDMLSFLNSLGSTEMPNELRVGNKFYHSSARELKDSSGPTIDIDSRADVQLGSSSSYTTKSKIQINSNTNNQGNSTVLSTDISLTAGKVKYSWGSGITLNLGNIITPVLRFLRQEARERSVIPGGFNTVDISDITMSIEDSWQTEEYHTVSHSGSISINIFKPGVSDNAVNQIIDSIGKARYTTIKLALTTKELDSNNSNPSEFFTGILMNPVIEERAGRRVITFEIHDFWNILQDSLIINSPYFDGEIDTNVILYLLRYIGFKNSSINLHNNSLDALPISFDWQSPSTKFENRSPISEAIKTLAKRYSKYAFFDRKGIFNYQRIPSVLIDFNSDPNVAGAVVHKFYSTHRLGVNQNVTPIGRQQSVGGFGVAGLLSNDQMAYEVKTTGWSNRDIFNQILLHSVDARSRGIIVVGDTNEPSLTDPNAFGYLGYKKMFYQEEAAFGAIGRVRKILRYYSRMYQPFYKISWKTFGGNRDLKPFDVVAVDDNAVVIQRISNSIVAEDNKWETEYEGEWIFPPIKTMRDVIPT